MRKLLKPLIVIFFLMYLIPTFAQSELIVDVLKVENNPDIQKLENQKEKVSEIEKNLLKKKVRQINKALENGDISEEEADLQKKTAAEKHAQNIEDQHKIIDANIALIIRNLEEDDNKAYYQHMKYLTEKNSHEVTDSETEKKTRKIVGDLVLNVGFSNTIGSDKSIGDDFSLGGSRFVDLGYEWNRGLTKNNFLRLRYGFSFQFNGLSAVDNQFLVKDENKQVHLEEFDIKLKKSKLRVDNLVLPVYLELGPANKYGYANKFKVGVGGFVGFNLKNVQKLKYKEEGYRVRKKDYFNSQTEDLIYGLGAYLGYGSWGLFARYNINPLFKHNPVKERVIAAGIRIML